MSESPAAHEIVCGGCREHFVVNATAKTARCGSCGTKHGGPWDAPEVLSSPLLEEDVGEPEHVRRFGRSEGGDGSGEHIQLDINVNGGSS